MPMDRSRRIVDHLLRDVIGNGDVSHLPGAGKPLPLNDDPLTPIDQRAAHKIMDDHNVAPEWVETGRALSKSEENLLAEAGERAERYCKELKAVSTGVHRIKLEKRWSRYIADFRERVKRHNREALLYNLKVPAGILHKPILNSDSLLERALESAMRGN